MSRLKNDLRMLLQASAEFRSLLAIWLVAVTASSVLDILGLSMFFPLSQLALGQGVPAALQRHLPETWTGTRGLIALSFVMTTLLCTKNALVYLSKRLEAEVSIRTQTRWIERIAERIVFSNLQFFVKEGMGAILEGMLTNPMRAGVALKQFWLLVSAVLFCTAYYAVLLCISVKGTLVLTGLTLLLFGVLQAGMFRPTYRLGQEFIEARRTMSNRVLDAVNGILQIKIFSGERLFLGQLGRSLEEYNRISFARDRRRDAVAPLAESYLITCLVAATALLAWGRDARELQSAVPLLATYALFLARFVPQLVGLAQMNASFIHYVPSLRRTIDDTKLPADREILDRGRPLPPVRGSIVLDDVKFQYAGRHDFELAASLELPLGRTIGLAGPSGSGKSTLAHLLCGLYAPASGAIRIDGADLAEANLASWRRQIGYVSQDCFIFHGSVHDNIAIGAPDAGPKEIEQAARLAHAHEFIERLPEGYDTVLGEKGLKLSGGQRQRLAIARAVVRRPKVFIFDEATNSLDKESESLVHRTIETLSEDRSRLIVIVAHDLSALRRADSIVVLTAGRVAEQGTHEELMALRGTYWSLRRLQEDAAIPAAAAA